MAWIDVLFEALVELGPPLLELLAAGSATGAAVSYRKAKPQIEARRAARIEFKPAPRPGGWLIALIILFPVAFFLLVLLILRLFYT